MVLVPIDCKWGEYGNWTQCSKTCGGGNQIRTRVVATQARNGGKQCDGANTDLKLCNEFPCPGKLHTFLCEYPRRVLCLKFKHMQKPRTFNIIKYFRKLWMERLWRMDWMWQRLRWRYSVTYSYSFQNREIWWKTMRWWGKGGAQM